jgi:hypothetical protein
MKHHGGFRVGEKVDVRFRGHRSWEDGFYIVDFIFMTVKVKKGSDEYLVSIHHIRKPNLRIDNAK